MHANRNKFIDEEKIHFEAHKRNFCRQDVSKDILYNQTDKPFNVRNFQNIYTQLLFI